MDNIKVYKMNDCDFVATNLSKKDTHEWYKKLYGFNDEDCPIEGVEECNIKENGVYGEVSLEEAHKLLDELYHTGKVNNSKRLEFRDCSILTVYTSFEEVLKEYKEIKEPFIIASTEY